MFLRLRVAGRIALLALKAPVLLVWTQLRYLAFARAFKQSAARYGLPPEAIRQLSRELRPMQLMRAIPRARHSQGKHPRGN